MGMAAMRARRLALSAARFGVAYATLLLATGLAMVVAGDAYGHVWLTGLGAPLSFYAGVAAAYIYSMAPAAGLPLAALLAASLAAYSLEPILPRLFLPLHLLGSLLGLAASLLAARRGRARTVALGLAAVYLTGAAAAVLVRGLGYIEAVLVLLYSVPFAAIYPVNLFSLYKTYHRGGLAPLLALVLGLHAAGTLWRAATGETLVLSLAALAYAAALLAAALPMLSRHLRQPGRGSTAWRAHLYFLEGQLVAALVAAAYAAEMLAGADPITEAHLVDMGFIAVHIYVHAPLMIPIIYGLRSGKRYNPTPYLLLLASLALRLTPSLQALAAPVFAASLAALAYVMAPPATGRRGRSG